MNTKLKSIKLCVHGVNIKCSTNNPEFLKYIKDHMYFFLADTSINSDIETNIIFNKENRIRSLAGLEKLGVNLYQDKEKLVYIEKNLDLEASYLDGLMVIDSQVDKNSGLKESLKKVLKFLFRRRVEKNHEFFMLLRRLIIFPVFYFMENFKEIYQMHASAFVLENKTVVIAGLANVGKSTSSLAATLDLKGKLISDNYLLYNKSKVFCFPELVRVSDETLNLIDDKSELGDHLYVRGHRKLYALSSNQIAANGTIDALIIPSLGDRHDCEVLSSEYAIDLIMSSNEYVDEFHNTDYISILKRIKSGPYSVFVSRVNALRELLEDTSVYSVTLSSNHSAKENVEYIMNIINKNSIDNEIR